MIIILPIIHVAPKRCDINGNINMFICLRTNPTSNKSFLACGGHFLEVAFSKKKAVASVSFTFLQSTMHIIFDIDH